MIYFKDPAVGHAALRYPTQIYLTAEEVLLPLVSNLCNVRRLDLSSLPLDWTPAFLGRLASAWFNLTSLALSDCAVPTCRIQVSDLLPFAQLCPALRSLIIHVSPPMPEAFPSAVEGEYHDVEISHGSQRLKLAEAVFDPGAVPRVAAFLYQHFPSTILNISPYTVAGREWDPRMRQDTVRINRLRRPQI